MNDTQTAQHTPGPWRIVRRDNKPVGLAYGYLRIETQASGASVAALQPPERDTDADANARLIAAAPDLLAALERYVEADLGNEEDDLNRTARAAIAKATGEGV